MIKKILLTIAVCLPMLASAQTVKIGLIDTQAIATATPEYKTGEADIDALNKKYQEQVKALQEEGQRMLEDYQKLPDDTAPAIREHKAQALQQQDQTIQTFMQNAQQDLQRKEAEIMQSIQAKIAPAIESVGKEGGYTLIMPIDVAAYYSAPAEDITKKVLTKLGL